MKKLSLLIVCALLAAGSVLAQEPWTPIQLSLVDPVQVPNDEYSVVGLRLNLIYGKCQDMWGVDVGIVNQTEKNMNGLEAGVVNINKGHVAGVQFGLVSLVDGDMEGIQGLPFIWGHIYARVSGNMIGLQDGLGNRVKGETKVAQIGIVNYDDLDMLGLQIGGVNIVKGDIEGLDIGVVNVSAGMYGLQIGLFNYTEKLEGIQIGLINCAMAKETFKVLPIVNAAF